jgi:hypothetical protein
MAVWPMEELENQEDLQKQAIDRIRVVLSHVRKDQEELSAALAQRGRIGVEGLSAVREVIEALERLKGRLDRV